MLRAAAELSSVAVDTFPGTAGEPFLKAKAEEVKEKVAEGNAQNVRRGAWQAAGVGLRTGWYREAHVGWVT